MAPVSERGRRRRRDRLAQRAVLIAAIVIGSVAALVTNPREAGASSGAVEHTVGTPLFGHDAAVVVYYGADVPVDVVDVTVVNGKHFRLTR